MLAYRAILIQSTRRRLSFICKQSPPLFFFSIWRNCSAASVDFKVYFWVCKPDTMSPFQFLSDEKAGEHVPRNMPPCDSSNPFRGKVLRFCLNFTEKLFNHHNKGMFLLLVFPPIVVTPKGGTA